MSTHPKKSPASIHRIREFELEKVNLAEEFDILQIVGEGWFGKILLVEHRATDTEMVLKALPKAYTALRDFYREFHYGFHLGAHKHIITTYDVAFETAGFYVFSQEYAPLGDLTSNVTENGIGELHTKRVAKQLTSALEHLHARELVHRDVKLDNILIFKSDFSRIKLCDFGETRRVGSVVRRRNEWLPYAPPEVLQIDTDDNYKTLTSHDVWQFGIVMFVCLTGCLPWQKAASDDPRFSRFTAWHSSALSPIRRQPKLFKLISSKAQRLFRKLLEPKPEKRPNVLSEVHRFLEDRWMAKTTIDKNSGIDEDDGLCPSMYSFHSSPEEKNKLLHSLIQYGLETTVDREAKKDRIRAWIQNSVIEEEDETLDNSSTMRTDETSSSLLTEEEEEENIVIHDNEHGPAGERMNRGPISTSRSAVINSTIPQEKSPGPLAPPRKHNKMPRTSATKFDISTPYAPPIDPTIPFANQKIIETSILKNATSRRTRNPNAFLFENGTSKTTLPQSSDTLFERNKEAENPPMTIVQQIIPNLQKLQQKEHSETKSALANTAITVLGGLNSSLNSPTQIPNETEYLKTKTSSNLPQQGEIVVPKTIPNAKQQTEIIKQRHYHENLKKAFANTALVAVTGVAARKDNTQTTEPPKEPPKIEPPVETRKIAPKPAPLKNKQTHYMENMKKAFANTALVAVTGVSVHRDTETAVDKVSQYTEKEQDRNYAVYGISPPTLKMSIKRSEIIEAGSGSSKSSNASQTGNSKLAKTDKRHVTFSGGTAGGSSRSGSK